MNKKTLLSIAGCTPAFAEREYGEDENVNEMNMKSEKAEKIVRSR